MKKTDINEVTICGKVTASVYWPPKNKYKVTSGKVQIQVDSGKAIPIVVDVPINLENPSLSEKQFKEMFEVGNNVLLFCKYNHYESKKEEGKTVFQLTSNISSVTQASNSLNVGIVSGKVTSHFGKGFVIESTYFGMAPNKKRVLKVRKVAVKSESADEDLLGKRVLVIGKAQGSNTGAFLLAEQLSIFK